MDVFTCAHVCLNGCCFCVCVFKKSYFSLFYSFSYFILLVVFFLICAIFCLLYHDEYCMPLYLLDCDDWFIPVVLVALWNCLFIYALILISHFPEIIKNSYSYSAVAKIGERSVTEQSQKVSWDNFTQQTRGSYREG